MTKPAKVGGTGCGSASFVLQDLMEKITYPRLPGPKPGPKGDQKLSKAEQEQRLHDAHEFGMQAAGGGDEACTVHTLWVLKGRHEDAGGLYAAPSFCSHSRSCRPLH